MRWAIPLITILFSAAASGQSTNGTITGVVTDQTGAVVAGAAILARNPDTGFTYSATSTNTGNYTVPLLPTGTYELQIGAAGFRQFERKGLLVQPANVVRIDVQMQLGTTTDTVTVTEETPILKTENSATVHNVNVQQLQSLPILPVNGGGTNAATNGLRDPYALLKTVPGTRYVPSTSMSSNGNNGMNILIEGMTGNMVNPAGTVTMQTQPSAEAVQEVAVLTSNYSAEFGNISGAVLNVTMRSGTNQFHGTAYAYGVNEVMNAAQPFSGRKSTQRRYDYGTSLGGPLRIPKLYNGINKTFFFFSYEAFLENGTINTTTATVPLPAYRRGDFSQLIPLSGNQPVRVGTANFVDPLGSTILSGTIFDPNTTRTVVCDKTAVPTATCTAGSLVQMRSPFPGNQVPLTSFDPVAVKIQDLVPLPLGPNANSGQPSANFQNGWNNKMTTYLPSIKVDHMFGAKNHVSGYFQTVRYQSPLVFPNGMATGLPQPVEPGRGATSSSQTARVTEDYTLTPTLLLHFSAGYSAQGIWLLPPITDYNAVTELGLKGATVNRLFPNITTSGAVVPTNTGGMTTIGPQGGFLTTQSSAQLSMGQASATWVKSNHTVKSGFDWRWEFQPVNSLTNTAGNYTFGPNGTQQIALQGLALAAGTTGFPHASFLMGSVSNIRISAPANYRDQKSQTAVFVQDTWKVARNLTLDFGLRYDYGTYLRERGGRSGAFSATASDPIAGGRPGGAVFEATCNCRVSSNYPWAFAPRVGVAYKLGDKNVLRAGFGIVYAPTAYAQGTVVSASDSGTPAYGEYIFQLKDGIPESIRPVWPNFAPDAGRLKGTVGASPAVLGSGAGRPPRQYQWSIGLQRALTSNLVVEASYVANRVIWLGTGAANLATLNKLSVPMLNQMGFQIGNLNDAAILRTPWGSLNPAQRSTLASRGVGLPYADFPVAQLTRQAVLPFPQYSSHPTFAALGNSWFDALQFSITQRFYHGLTFNANYMYSKNLANTSPVDPFNRSLGKDLAGLDLPHQFRLSATYTVPEQRSGLFGKNKVISYIVSGWQIGTYLQYQSAPILAQPASPTTNPISQWLGYGPGPAQLIPGQSVLSSNWTDYNGVTHTTPIDLNCKCFNPQTTVVLNPSAWTAVPDAQFGANQTSLRYFRGFRQPEESANFARNFRITEKTTIQIRAEWTNIFNRLLLPQPNTAASYLLAPTRVNSVYTGGYGTVIPTAGNGITSMRSGQLIARITF